MDIDRELSEYRICRDWEDQAWADDMHERISSMAKDALAEFANPPYPAEWWEALQWNALHNMPCQPTQRQFQLAQQQYSQQSFDPWMMGNPLAGLLGGMTSRCECCGR